LNPIIEGIIKAFQLIFSGDPSVYGIVLRSLFISGAAALIAILWGTPIAMLIGLKSFRGKFLIKTVFNTLIGIPTVALGLILFLLFEKEAGILGFLHLLYTQPAMIIGEAILITPIIVSFATTAIETVDPQVTALARTLGASESRASVTVLKEASSGIFLAGIACFNRAVAELGVALMIGGNIEGLTDVMTTVISRETGRGNISLAIALSVILLSIVFGITVALNIFQRRRKWAASQN
jgi:tungstate transport system permease protein